MNLIAPPKEDPHNRSSRGILERYQDRLSERFSVALLQFKEQTAAISSECQEKLAELMHAYREKEQEIKSKQKGICDSLATTNETYESLKNTMISLAETLLKEAKELHRESMVIYESYFDKIAPLLYSMYQENKDLIPQISDTYHGHLIIVIGNINSNYLKAKKDLIKSFYVNELDVIKSNNNLIKEFEERSVEWRVNRYAQLVHLAKERLEPKNPLDLTPFYEEFREMQTKFNQTFQKMLASVSNVIPPRAFTQESLNKWWDEVEKNYKLNEDFLNHNISKLQRLVDERNNENAEFVVKLQAQLADLKDESAATVTIGKLQPLVQMQTEYNAQMVERITRYWNMRKEGVLKAFTEVKDFYEPIIAEYNKFITSLHDLTEDCRKKQDDEKERSQKALENYEQELDDKTNEINLQADQAKIKQCVNECNQILNKIENEYRSNYQNIIAILDQEPIDATTNFNQCEEELLHKLNLKKTKESTEFAQQSQQPTRKQKEKQPKTPRTARGKNRNKENDVAAFTFELPNGAAYEETEHLTIIQPAEEFTDEPIDPKAKGKGKAKAKPKPKPKPKAKPKAKRRGKKGEEPPEEVDELDQDFEPIEFKVFETIPKVDDQLLIYVHIPLDSECDELQQTFKKTLIQEVSNIYSEYMYKCLGEDVYKQELADQLTERLRVHAPRSKAIELNVANARTLQIEGRKAQVEHHIRRSVQQFNKSSSNIDGMIMRKKESILAECEKLTTFIEELSKQKSSLAFTTLTGKLTQSDKQFMDEFAVVKKDVMERIETFAQNTNGANERFIKTVVDDISIPQEEKDMTCEYFKRLQERVDVVLEETRQKAKNHLAEVENRHNEILQEFDTKLLANKADIKLLENLLQQTREAKLKFDSVLSRNKQIEIEIDHAIQAVNNSCTYDCETNLAMQKQFESLDNMRILLINRGVYLAQLAKPFNADPIAFTVDFDAGLSSEDSGVSKTMPRSSDKSKSIRPKIREVKKKGKNKYEVEGPNSFNGLIEKIAKDFKTKIQAIATDYYNSLAARTTPITRPEQIPGTQEELLQLMTDRWNEIIKPRDEALKQYILRFKSHVISAQTAARNLIKVFFDCLESYYNTAVLKLRGGIQTKYEEIIGEINTQKDQHKKKLNPVLAGPNNEQLFNQLLAEENDRFNVETRTIIEYQNQVLENEKRVASIFIVQLNVVSGLLLQLFDSFVTIDDVQFDTSLSQSVQRKTMKELLKDQQRVKLLKKSTQMRQWPQLAPYSFQTGLFLTSYNDSDVSRTSSRKRRVRRSTDKSPDTFTVDKDNSPPLQSYDTQLQRGTIVERNRAYEEYEMAMRSRMENFRDYSNSFINDMAAFQEYWKKCVTNLKGEENSANVNM